MIKGISNLGLTCAASSLLQVLLNNKHFVQHIIDHRVSNSFCDSLYSLFSQYRRCLHEVNPKGFYDFIHLNVRQQNDVIDLIDFLIPKIEDIESSNFQLIYSNSRNEVLHSNYFYIYYESETISNAFANIIQASSIQISKFPKILFLKINYSHLNRS